MLSPLSLLLIAQGAPADPSPLERMVQAMAGHRAVSFTSVAHMGFRKEITRQRYLAPNFFSIESGEPGTIMVVSDGTYAYSVNPYSRQWSRAPLAASLKSIASMPGFGLVFPNAPAPQRRGEAHRGKFLGKDAFEVPLVSPSGSQGDLVVLYIDPQTWLPCGMVIKQDGEADFACEFKDIALDPPLKPEDFRFTPPAGYRDGNAPGKGAKAMVDVPLPRIPVRPGAWTGHGYPPIRVASTFRTVGRQWAVDVESQGRNAYLWSKAQVTATFEGKRSRASLTVKADGRHAVAVIAKSGNMPPTKLDLLLTTREAKPRQATFAVEWRHASAR